MAHRTGDRPAATIDLVTCVRKFEITGDEDSTAAELDVALNVTTGAAFHRQLRFDLRILLVAGCACLVARWERVACSVALVTVSARYVRTGRALHATSVEMKPV